MELYRHAATYGGPKDVKLRMTIHHAFVELDTKISIATHVMGPTIAILLQIL